MPETYLFVVLDGIIIAYLAYTVHLLRGIRHNTRKSDNKDLFQK